ncbi:MAG: complex I subunit 4 family protein [Dehalococcoidia bacterium]
MSAAALLALVVVPLGAAVLLLFVPSRFDNVVRTIAVIAALAMFGLSVYIFVAYNISDGGIQGDMRWDWLSNVAFLSNNGITLHLGVDGIAVPLVLLNGIVALAGTWVSFKIEYRNKDFFVLLFTLIAGVFGTFLSLDLFFFFFFYELAVLPMYLLIVIWGSGPAPYGANRDRTYGGMKLTMMLVAASIGIFIAIFAIFNQANAGTFDLPTLWATRYPVGFQKTFFPFIMIGCGVLAGLWPFHGWSPDGHAAAPTAVSMLHAGVLMKLGAFGIIRLGIQMMPEGAHFWMPALMVLGVTASLYGAFAATGQRDWKLMTGYSSVSHMGYVLMGLATLNAVGVNGAVLQMFSHGVMTALFFAMIGSVYDQSHTRDLRAFGGLVRKMPRFVALFTLAGFASLGLPGLSGFVAEFNIFVGTFKTYPLFGALGVFSALITATYILRMFSFAFFGPFNERWSGLRDLLPTELLAGGLLSAAILFLGMWPSPFVDRIADGLRDIPAVCPSGQCSVNPFKGNASNQQAPPGKVSGWAPDLRRGDEPLQVYAL